MNLTVEQQQDLARGKAVPIIVDQTRCVLLRADAYEHAQRMLEDRGTAEAYPAILQAWDLEGNPQDAEAYADCGRRS